MNANNAMHTPRQKHWARQGRLAAKSKIQYAKFEAVCISLNNDWARNVACEKFGTELVESFPRITRGKNTGKLKGYLCYLKVSVGGWSNTELAGRGPGVLLPGAQDWHLSMTSQFNDPKGHAVVARWHHSSGVEVIQTPAHAQSLFKVYGKEARYA